MWLEANLSRQDILRALEDLMPVTIALGDDGALRLDKPTDVSFAAGQKLRVVCEVRLCSSVFGLRIPLAIDSATVLLEAAIERRSVLVFQVRLEERDVATDGSFVDLVNKKLAAHQAELVWDFRSTLGHRFDFPATLDPVRAMEVSVGWGVVHVTPEALMLAISVHPRADVQGPMSPADALSVPTARGLSSREARSLAIDA
jgi:hypothetical protein